MITEAITHESPSGAVHRRRIPANCWQGERGCLVGPFRAKNLAEEFEHYVLHQNGVRTTAGALREHEDGWYIAIPS